MVARLALLAALLLVARPSTADAAESGEIEAAAWVPVVPVAATPSPSGGQATRTSDGTVFVSAAGGSEAARAFLSLRHGDAGDLQLVRLVLPESPQSLDAASAVVQACPSTLLLPDETSEVPEADCEAMSAVGIRADGGTWTFDLSGFAALWTDDTIHTVALVPVPADPTSNFTVAYVADDGGVEIERAPAPTATGSAETSLFPVVTPPTRTAPPTVTPARQAPAPAPAPSLPSPSNATPEPDGPSPTEVPALEVAGAKVGSVNSPPTALVLFLALAATVGILLAAGWHPASAGRQIAHDGRMAAGARLGLGLAGAAALASGPLFMSEVRVFQLGLLLIFFTAALGLHMLVNWAGELSLAHAGLVGLPAFVVAKLASDLGVSPILLVPLGVAIGVAAGTIIALPALRTSGLYVAISTLAAGIAIDRFFFTRDWLVAARSATPTPSLFGMTFASTKSLFPVLVVLCGLGLLAAMALHRSQVARGMMWMRVDRTAAAAFGIAVDRQRVLAFAVAGAYAGLAGGMTFTWTSLATPSMFPLTLSLTYLAAVVVAGPGGVGGLVAATAMLEGGRLFVPGSEDLALYAGPIALMLVLTRFPSGINGLGRFLMKKISAATPGEDVSMRSTENGGSATRRPLSTSFVAGVLAITAGFTSIVVAWYHTGNTDQLWIQTQEFLLGGLGGLGLIVVGATLLLRDALMTIARSTERTALTENGVARSSRRPLRATRARARRAKASA